MLADQQVPAVGDHPQRRSQPPRVLERVANRELMVARAPEHEDGTADAVEIEPDVVADERLRRADGVRVPGGPGEESLGELGRQCGAGPTRPNGRRPAP